MLFSFAESSLITTSLSPIDEPRDSVAANTRIIGHTQHGQRFNDTWYVFYGSIYRLYTVVSIQPTVHCK